METVIGRLASGEEKEASALERGCLETGWSEKQIAEALLNPEAVYLTAKKDGRICGTALMYSVCGEGQLINLAVAADERRQGIGEKLLCSLISFLASSGGKSMTLEVEYGNEGAKALYEKCGFTAVGTRRGFYRGKDALVMEKKL